MELRDYQHESEGQLRIGYRNGHRSQLLVAPTGSGKTVVAAHILKQARDKGTRSAFVVDRINLVNQTSAVLDSYGIDHGIVQADHWRRRGEQPIQVCSAQTLEKRGFFPDLSFLVVDEAHVIRRTTADLIQSMTSLKVLGLTATPFTKGLSELYTQHVNVTTTNKLIAEGWLVPVKMYAAIAPNMDGAKIIAGEWADKEIEQRGITIVGDIVKEWEEKTRHHFGGPAKTIVFAATVDHGAELCKEFGRAGYRFEQVSYRDANENRRTELIAEYRKPDSQIVGLVSCEVFTKGFDVPDVLVAISARPYRKSFSSFIQQLGRILRPAPGKHYGVWLDHAGNCIRFYADMVDLFQNGVRGLDNSALDSKLRKEPTAEEKEALKCRVCSYLLPPRALVCPACGYERPRKVIEMAAGVMVTVGGKEVQAAGKYEFLADRDSVWQQLVSIALDRKHGDVDKARKFAQAQHRNFFGVFAHKNFDDTVPMPPDPKLEGLVQRNVIAYAKTANKRARP